MIRRWCERARNRCSDASSISGGRTFSTLIFWGWSGRGATFANQRNRTGLRPFASSSLFRPTGSSPLAAFIALAAYASGRYYLAFGVQGKKNARGRIIGLYVDDGSLAP